MDKYLLVIEETKDVHEEMKFASNDNKFDIEP